MEDALPWRPHSFLSYWIQPLKNPLSISVKPYGGGGLVRFLGFLPIRRWKMAAEMEWVVLELIEHQMLKCSCRDCWGGLSDYRASRSWKPLNLPHLFVHWRASIRKCTFAIFERQRTDLTIFFTIGQKSHWTRNNFLSGSIAVLNAHVMTRWRDAWSGFFGDAHQATV